jgi:hypothetical protein
MLLPRSPRIASLPEAGCEGFGSRRVLDVSPSRTALRPACRQHAGLPVALHQWLLRGPEIAGADKTE